MIVCHRGDAHAPSRLLERRVVLASPADGVGYVLLSDIQCREPLAHDRSCRRHFGGPDRSYRLEHNKFALRADIEVLHTGELSGDGGRESDLILACLLGELGLSFHSEYAGPTQKSESQKARK